MLDELARAFFLIFVAEMGDKTQIMAMTFATQYKRVEVLLGVFIGVILNHGMAIVLGKYLSKIVPLNLLQIIAGFMFVIFGLLSLKDEEDEEEKSKKYFGPIITVAIAFFLGELGDKTQLTALTLATEGKYPLFILLGTTLGMIVVSGLGILVGSKIGEKIPEVFIKIVSSLVFLFFGTYKLLTTLPGKYKNGFTIFIYFVIIGLVEFYFIRKLIDNQKIEKKSALKEAAATLYLQTEELKEAVDEICLGENICGSCKKDRCLIGSIKEILEKALKEGEYYYNEDFNYSNLIEKDYEEDKIIYALSLILADYKKFGIELDQNFILNKVRKALEIILFEKEIPFHGDIDKYLRNIRKKDKNIWEKIRRKIEESV